MNIFEKIIAIFVSEFVEAIFFLVFIFIFVIFGENFAVVKPITDNMIAGLASAWGIVGIATPFVIGFEVWNYFGGQIRRY
jgi:hypothetical protein